MTKKKKQTRKQKQSSAAQASAPVAVQPSGPSKSTYLWLALLGTAAALWALFLWNELIKARTSGTSPFCAFGDEGSCGALWDSAFASGIHSWTGLPVAAWGLLWGLVALALPLAGWFYRRGQAHPGQDRATPARISAWIPGGIAWTALAGAVGVVVLLAASAASGLFCSSCAITYVVTIAYAVLALRGRLWPDGRGLVAALIVLAPAYLVLLGPGRSTPASSAEADRDALAAAVQAAGETSGETAGPEPAEPAAPVADYPEPPPPERTEEKDQLLARFLDNLDPRYQQAISDALEMYRQGIESPLEAPRELLFTPGASLRLTTFSDFRCSHCATLHGTIEQLAAQLPPGLFSLDARNYPLDGACNPRLPQRSGPEDARCIAARARVCFEGSGHANEYSTALYQNQQQLSENLVYQLAIPYKSPAALDSCINSPATKAKVAADIEYAARYEISGTPLVTINGREGPAFGPFLYAIILAAGDADHPAFADLPTPNEPTGHEGHDH